MKMTDEQLIFYTGKADKKAFRELYQRYSARIYSLTKKMLGYKHREYDEVFQEAMLRIWQKAPLFDAQKGKAKSWIYLVATRHILNWLDSKAARNSSNETELHDELQNEKKLSPEELALGTVESERARKLLDRLPEDMKQAIVLRHIEDLSISEISEIAGCPQGTVKSRIFNGLKRLRSFFARENSHE
jgi:RNA polymerase sigma-70 factor (ECF subfamily)